MKKNNVFLSAINSMFGIEEIQEKPTQIQPESFYGSEAIYSPWYPVNTSVAFDGEKTYGQLGMPVNVIPIHEALRMRAYEADLKTDIVKIITGRFFKWVVGSGLKLQAEPNEIVLSTEGIVEDMKQFRKDVEARFSVYSESNISDFSRMQNLHVRAEEAFRTAFLGGDCLCIIRYEDDFVNIQVIDGQEIINPDKDSYYKEAKENKNTISKGIEINQRGEHVAFYVRMQKEDGFEIERMIAKGDDGRTYAWMLYGSKHRINHHRGIPQISSILEKVNKLDRYTEAMVSSAEERAKIVYSIEHNQFSTGENIAVDILKKNFNPNGNPDSENPFKQAEILAKNIELTTEKQTFNMPIGAKMSVLDSDQESNYEPFFKAVFMQICAAVDIPPEVALQQYNSNYSASRAAINGWGYIIDIYRKKFSNDFYKKIYSLWLETEILKGKVKSSGYIKAIRENNVMAIEAYRSSRFTGVNMPHIDPLKEVKAIREMLGDPTKGIPPIINFDKASELLNQGNWSENFTKYLEELKDIEKNIPKPEPVQPNNTNQNVK